MNIAFVKEKLANGDKFVLSGAMGTEILRRGVKTSLPLWSADCLLTNPDIISAIHRDYIKAGVDIITTNTFRTQRRTFKKAGIENKAEKATLLACRLAKNAVKKFAKKPVLIAGSVAPLEDCYSPELTPPIPQLRREHREQVRILIRGGVDFILAETMITLREAEAIAAAAVAEGIPFAVSFCINKKGELLGGETLETAVWALKKYKPLFFAINCIDLSIANKHIGNLAVLVQGAVGVYAQGDGSADDDQGWKFKGNKKEEYYVSCSINWIQKGAQIIGGCCGTTPSYIKKIAKEIENQKRKTSSNNLRQRSMLYV